MTKLLAKTGDRLLGAFLGRVDAGACIPENGQRCACRSGWLYRYNCTGSCLKTTSHCT
jgi:hypothetical protein